MAKRVVKLREIKWNSESEKEARYTTAPIASDYFARFRFNLEELLVYLKQASGKPFSQVPFVYQCLDDLGHWSFVRHSEIFHFSEHLETVLTQQFAFLQKSFDYAPGDILIWGDLQKSHSERFPIQVKELVAQGDQELFRVEVLGTMATMLVSRYELDYWNASGSTLPVDAIEEEVDWSKDFFWTKKLSDFKAKLANDGFRFNFEADENEKRQQQEFLLKEIREFFTLEEGSLIQRDRGIGFLSCGQGGQAENLAVLTLALQALAQPFGIRARLWGIREFLKELPQFIMLSYNKRSATWGRGQESIFQEPTLRPLQKPLSEVLRRLIAKGPFGKPESLASIRGSLEKAQGKSERESGAQASNENSSSQI
ncbi:MAG: hypothetical protein RJB66_1527 [Pseudomonadota bacterium]|jgi:hypothetical protein